MDSTENTNKRITDEEALAFHSAGRPGKISIAPTKPLTTQRDLSLAYSPGVAVPCLHIEKDPRLAYEYTSKGNLVAVISNGTAVLGLGDIGALASKPVMEGKAVLFKRFADVDSIDLEVDTRDADEFINCVRFLGPSFGGINLEDIKAPECFIIEQRLKEVMDIPVFHDDQHGTAVICAAGLINALELSGKRIEDVRIVLNGAGAAGVACEKMLADAGVSDIIMLDSRGIIHAGRGDLNEVKDELARTTNPRGVTGGIFEAFEGADTFIGVSAGSVPEEALQLMAERPILFSLANPNPEIDPELSRRYGAVVATGRSDLPNQINNVLAFPGIFHGAETVVLLPIGLGVGFHGLGIVLWGHSDLGNVAQKGRRW